MTAMTCSILPGSKEEQLIIAGGDEDVSSDELLEWVSPLLAGIPQGRWATCQIDWATPTDVLARFRCGRNAGEFHFHAAWTAEEVQLIKSEVPSVDALALVVVETHSSQVITLLDSVASWLNLYEADNAAIAPFVKLFGEFFAMV